MPENIDLLYTQHFLKSVKKLPFLQQEKLSHLLGILKQQPFSPLLHTKSLSGALTGFYSFRITRDYRVIFQFLGSKTIKLIDTAHRKDIYK